MTASFHFDPPYSVTDRFILAALVNIWNNLPSTPNAVISIDGPSIDISGAITIGTREMVAALVNMLGNMTADQATVLVAGPVPTTPGPAPVPVPVPTKDFFPADPTQAPPSPEGSATIWFNGAVGGNPYVRDKSGNIWQLRGVGNPLVPTVFFNGISQGTNPDPQWSGHADSPPSKIQIYSGGAYVLLQSGIWQAGPPWYNASPPVAGTPAPTPVPVGIPPAPAVLPGTSGKIILAGPTQTIKTLTAALTVAADGDTIQMDPSTYKETPPTIQKIVKIDLGGSTLDASGMTATLARGKGLMVGTVPYWIDNGTITGVAMDQTTGQNTSAIRRDDACPWVKITRMNLHGNQCGVGWGGGVPGVLEVADSDISGNGIAGINPNTHNLYVDATCTQLTLTNVISKAPIEAHAIKYRGPKLICNGGTFSSEAGSCFNFPNGCAATITNCHLIKPAGSSDHKIISLDDAQTNGVLPINIVGGSIDALCDSPFMMGPAGVTITLSGVTLTGNPITAQGVTLVGAGTPGPTPSPPPAPTPILSPGLSFNGSTGAVGAYLSGSAPASVPVAIGVSVDYANLQFGASVAFGDSVGNIMFVVAIDPNNGGKIGAFVYLPGSQWLGIAGYTSHTVPGQVRRILLVIVSATERHLYVDGIEAPASFGNSGGPVPAPASIPLPTAPLVVMFGGLGILEHNLNGTVKNAIVVAAVPTAAQVQADAAGVNPMTNFGADLWLWAKLDTAPDATNMLPDSSGQGHNLTAHAGADGSLPKLT